MREIVVRRSHRKGGTIHATAVIEAARAVLLAWDTRIDCSSEIEDLRKVLQATERLQQQTSPIMPAAIQNSTEPPSTTAGSS